MTRPVDLDRAARDVLAVLARAHRSDIPAPHYTRHTPDPTDPHDLYPKKVTR